MELFGIVLVSIVLAYLVLNKSRNSDPLNRKCASEICYYLVNSDELDLTEITLIFDEHARYQKQALHIASMIPSLLISEGVPSKDAMALVPLLQAAALERPK